MGATALRRAGRFGATVVTALACVGVGVGAAAARTPSPGGGPAPAASPQPGLYEGHLANGITVAATVSRGAGGSIVGHAGAICVPTEGVHGSDATPIYGIGEHGEIQYRIRRDGGFGHPDIDDSLINGSFTSSGDTVAISRNSYVVRYCDDAHSLDHVERFAYPIPVTRIGPARTSPVDGRWVRHDPDGTSSRFAVWGGGAFVGDFATADVVTGGHPECGQTLASLNGGTTVGSDGTFSLPWDSEGLASLSPLTSTTGRLSARTGSWTYINDAPVDRIFSYCPPPVPVTDSMSLEHATPNGNLTPSRIRFRLVLKSWIPTRDVVDPFRPFGYAPVPSSPQFHESPLPCSTFSYNGGTIHSVLNGNAHRAYSATDPGLNDFKVSVPMSFTVDRFSGEVSDVRLEDGVAQRWVLPGEPARGLSLDATRIGATIRTFTQGDQSCSERKFAKDTITSRDVRATGPRSFTASYAVSDPLVPGAPPLAVDLTGSVALDAPGVPSLDMTVVHSTFPSSAVRLVRGRTVAATLVFNDLACLRQKDVLGLHGLVALGIGLTSKDRHTLRIPDMARSVGLEQHIPGRPCKGLGGQIEGIWHPVGPISQPQPTVGIPLLSVRQTAPAGAAARLRTLTLTQARRRRLVSVMPDGRGGQVLGIVPGHGTRVILRHPSAFVLVSGSGRLRAYAPQGRRAVTIAPSSDTVSQAGRTLRRVRRSRRAPRTHLTVRHRGSAYTLRLRARAAAATATYVVVGRRRHRIVGGRLRLRVHRRTAIAYYSIDAFGRAERPHLRLIGPSRRR